jgi:hypothetical protein
MAERVATALGTCGGITAHVYRQPAGDANSSGEPGYYFACETCGNCGRVHTRYGTAVAEASSHVISPHHHQPEVHNARG